ncbi:hypothetical protein TRFO_35239 [Tritrichomonas foetus]|uniref:Uncharacterized protein n=1 Tax=Tritrichomonas foetus TaxID=1144522 RepID=A0A1J4JGW5_9EUKA|nr:hypothetical protein TRFO_35239 [Tritrichomonas foetus]|eukprot:OHS98390.1 hypothetical protein TRFO_35239 [Tritrichomonas foetus]
MGSHLSSVITIPIAQNVENRKEFISSFTKEESTSPLPISSKLFDYHVPNVIIINKTKRTNSKFWDGENIFIGTVSMPNTKIPESTFCIHQFKDIEFLMINVPKRTFSLIKEFVSKSLNLIKRMDLLRKIISNNSVEIMEASSPKSNFTPQKIETNNRRNRSEPRKKINLQLINDKAETIQTPSRKNRMRSPTKPFEIPKMIITAPFSITESESSETIRLKNRREMKKKLLGKNTKKLTISFSPKRRSSRRSKSEISSSSSRHIEFVKNKNSSDNFANDVTTSPTANKTPLKIEELPHFQKITSIPIFDLTSPVILEMDNTSKNDELLFVYEEEFGEKPKNAEDEPDLVLSSEDDETDSISSPSSSTISTSKSIQRGTPNHQKQSAISPHSSSTIKTPTPLKRQNDERSPHYLPPPSPIIGIEHASSSSIVSYDSTNSKSNTSSNPSFQKGSKQKNRKYFPLDKTADITQPINNNNNNNETSNTSPSYSKTSSGKKRIRIRKSNPSSPEKIMNSTLRVRPKPKPHIIKEANAFASEIAFFSSSSDDSYDYSYTKPTTKIQPQNISKRQPYSNVYKNTTLASTKQKSKQSSSESEGGNIIDVHNVFSDSDSAPFTQIPRKRVEYTKYVDAQTSANDIELFQQAHNRLQNGNVLPPPRNHLINETVERIAKNSSSYSEAAFQFQFHRSSSSTKVLPERELYTPGYSSSNSARNSSRSYSSSTKSSDKKFEPPVLNVFSERTAVNQVNNMIHNNFPNHYKKDCSNEIKTSNDILPPKRKRSLNDNSTEKWDVIKTANEYQNSRPQRRPENDKPWKVIAQNNRRRVGASNLGSGNPVLQQSISNSRLVSNSHLTTNSHLSASEKISQIIYTKEEPNSRMSTIPSDLQLDLSSSTKNNNDNSETSTSSKRRRRRRSASSHNSNSEQHNNTQSQSNQEQKNQFADQNSKKHSRAASVRSSSHRHHHKSNQSNTSVSPKGSRRSSSSSISNDPSHSESHHSRSLRAESVHSHRSRRSSVSDITSTPTSVTESPSNSTTGISSSSHIVKRRIKRSESTHSSSSHHHHHIHNGDNQEAHHHSHGSSSKRSKSEQSHRSNGISSFSVSSVLNSVTSSGVPADSSSNSLSSNSKHSRHRKVSQRSHSDIVKHLSFDS